MAVTALFTGVSFDKNVSAYVVAVPSADEDIFAQELKQVKVLMLDSLQNAMQGPANSASQYQIGTKGSLLRARLALASCKSFQCSADYAIAAAAACELVHNASLVHDDVLDGDKLRRGQPTVWKKHGKGVALCAGDLLLCTAFAVTAGLKDSQKSCYLTQHLAAMTCQVIVGQSVEIAPRQFNNWPRFRAYINAAQAKTAPLIQLPLLTGAIAVNAGQPILASIKRLAGAVGLAYQIIDDLDDLTDIAGPLTDIHHKVKLLHPFHAWHHHRNRLNDRPELRFLSATRHALALLQRAGEELQHLEQQLPTPITPTLGPLLLQLERRAQAHRYYGRVNLE
jgi:geranylgeranyl diphosphate synthase type II